MSRNGTFEGFFPSAPSVQQQKRKRAALDRERLEAPPDGTTDGVRSPIGIEPPAQHQNVKRPRLSSCTGHDEHPNVINEPGDLLNGVGSASSLHSTTSSVFSNGGQVPGSNQYGAGNSSHAQTPLTAPESSPLDKTHTPHQSKPLNTSAPTGNAESEFPENQERQHQHLVPPCATNRIERPSARPGVGEIKGEKVVYDPDLDRKLSSKERRNPNLKVRYMKFGEKVGEQQSRAMTESR